MPLSASAGMAELEFQITAANLGQFAKISLPQVVRVAGRLADTMFIPANACSLMVLPSVLAAFMSSKRRLLILATAAKSAAFTFPVTFSMSCCGFPPHQSKAVARLPAILTLTLLLPS